MSLANIQGKLSRTEMKNIMAGLKDVGLSPCAVGSCGPGGRGTCFTNYDVNNIPTCCGCTIDGGSADECEG